MVLLRTRALNAFGQKSCISVSTDYTPKKGNSMASKDPQPKPVVLVDYTGIDLVTNHMFESTMENHAKNGGIFDSRITYKPIPIILGMHELVAALEKELETMSEGQTKSVQLEPKDAYGERNPQKIRILSLKDFREHKMRPMPGLIIEADGQQGKVQSVSGGRVRCDFNHPLAGKQVLYELTLRKKIVDPKEKVSMLLAKFFPSIPVENVSVKDNAATIELPEELNAKPEADILKKIFERMMTEHVGFEKVEFVLAENKNSKTGKKTGAQPQSDAQTEPND